MGRTFEVTPETIELYQLDILAKRYRSLTRTIRKKEELYDPCELKAGKNYKRMKKEQELIQKHLADRQAEHLIAEQMTFPELQNAPVTYVALVEEKLSDHYIHLQQIKELEHKLTQGVRLTIPSCVASYGGVGGSSSHDSVSERLIVRAEEVKERWAEELEYLYVRIKPIQRALQQLGEEERTIIERKYLSASKPIQDTVIISKLENENIMSRRTFYTKKAEALRDLADYLRII